MEDVEFEVKFDAVDQRLPARLYLVETGYWKAKMVTSSDMTKMFTKMGWWKRRVAFGLRKAAEDRMSMNVR